MSWLFFLRGKRSRKASAKPAEVSSPELLGADGSEVAPSEPPSKGAAGGSDGVGANLSVDEVPIDFSDIRQVNRRVDEVKRQSAVERKQADAALAESRGDDVARAHLRKAIALNELAMSVANRYLGIRSLFDVSGRPVHGGNYPLTKEEAAFTAAFADLLGRQGGLLRRLGDLESAAEYYSRGANIELNGSALGVVNSYCALNSIVVKIELGTHSASEISAEVPSVAKDVEAAFELVLDQIENGGRRDDAWAMADLALAALLSGNEERIRKYVGPAYAAYIRAAGVQDVETTARVMKSILSRLEARGDPVANSVLNGLATLKRLASQAGMQSSI